MLDEEEGDTLINVNIVDDEKAEKNVELKKKKPDYNPYDAGDVDEYGMVIHVFLYMFIHIHSKYWFVCLLHTSNNKSYYFVKILKYIVHFFQFKEKNVLEKYDEEIVGAKKEKFQLGSGGKYNTDPEKQMDEIRRQLREQSDSLGGVSLNPINEYLTPQEAAVSRLPLLHAVLIF